ncbi:hypothetical protein CR513_02821, partial [Mucuna pruriens]
MLLAKKKSLYLLTIDIFQGLFHEEIPCKLPPIRGIEHQIYFTMGATLLNRAAYRANLKEKKGWVGESKIPCAVPIILVPKKNRSWRMCMDCHPINAITTIYRHMILHLDNLLGELYEGTTKSTCKKATVGDNLQDQIWSLEVTRHALRTDEWLKHVREIHEPCST